MLCKLLEEGQTTSAWSPLQRSFFFLVLVKCLNILFFRDWSPSLLVMVEDPTSLMKQPATTLILLDAVHHEFSFCFTQRQFTCPFLVPVHDVTPDMDTEILCGGFLTEGVPGVDQRTLPH